MVVSLLPNGQQQFCDENGVPYAMGTVTFYIPSTTTPKDTWQNPAQSALNANPLTLDAAGRATIWGNGSYRQILKDVDGNTIWDKVTSSIDFDGSSMYGTGFYGGFTAVGGETSFQLVNQSAASFTVDAGAEFTLPLYINGVKQQLANYTTDGTDVVVLNAITLVAGDLVYYEQVGGTASASVTPGAATITSASQFAPNIDMAGVSFDNLDLDDPVIDYASTVPNALVTDNVGLVTLASGATANRLLRTNGTAVSFAQANLATDVTGNLAVTHLNSGSGASGGTAWFGDGTWKSVAGLGDVVGPASSTDGALALFDGTSGKLLKEGGTFPASYTAPSALVANSSTVVSGAVGTTANRLLRTDGATISFAQAALSTDVTGILAVANGGLGVSTFGGVNTLLYTTTADTIDDMAIPNGIVKGNGAALSAATAGTDYMKADTTSTLTAGFDATPYNAGTISTGTLTLAPATGNLVRYVNGGAHTLAPPATDCSMVVQITNNGSAGTITTSGFTKVTGTAPTTVNNDDFMGFVTRINGFSFLSWQALQ